MTSTTLLAGDIGGTTTRLVLAELGRDGYRIIRREDFASGQYTGLDEILRQFVARQPELEVAGTCLAVAGPVRRENGHDVVHVTNLPWEIDSARVERIESIGHVRIINDFEAIGEGIPHLAPTELLILQTGVPVEHGPRAVIGAGTGLGQAVLVDAESGYRIFATEGGHVDFGPTDNLQIELAQWLLRTYGRSAYEEVLSGPGLIRLYNFLHERDGHTGVPLLSDPAAVSHAALNDDNPVAAEALDLFVRIYGAQAGNLALTIGATGGVYISGGIATRIREFIRHGPFLEAFLNKGSMRHYMERIPVQLVLSTDVGLRGALARAGASVGAHLRAGKIPK